MHGCASAEVTIIHRRGLGVVLDALGMRSSHYGNTERGRGLCNQIIIQCSWHAQICYYRNVCRHKKEGGACTRLWLWLRSPSVANLRYIVSTFEAAAQPTEWNPEKRLRQKSARPSPLKPQNINKRSAICSAVHSSLQSCRNQQVTVDHFVAVF